MKIKSILATSLLLGTTAIGGLTANAEVTADNNKTITHTVEAGDTLSSISQKYLGSTDYVKTLASSNQIKDENLIYVGDIIKFDTQNMTVTVTSAETHEEKTVPLEEKTTAPAEEAPVAETPVEEVTYTQEAPVQAAAEETSAPADSSSAKEWIAQRESTGSYTATNGRYIGRYQLDASYLNGDHSAANQEKVADSYVAGRYGSWENAKSFWLENGWY